MDIHKEGEVVFDTARFRHYHDPKMLSRYDSNFIAFKEMPNKKEFSDTEKYLQEYHVARGQKHVKFVFPPNEKLDDSLLTNLSSEGYDTGFTELYKINPRDFPGYEMQKEIEIAHVGANQLEDF